MAKRSEAVLVRLDPETKACLVAEAQSQMRAVSNLIALILTAHCETTKKPAKHVNGHAAKSATRVTA